MKCLNAIGYHPLEERTDENVATNLADKEIVGQNLEMCQCQRALPSSHNNGAEIADLVLLASIKNCEDIQKLSSEFMKRHWLKNLDLAMSNRCSTF